jgi:hypothetical protein
MHRLSGELAPGWNIDAVETTPGDALAEWFIDGRGDRRNIEIELTRSPRQNRSIYVIITGRLQRSNFAEPLTAETLRIVHWNHAHVGRHLLSFQTTEPFITETLGDMPTLGLEQISDSDRTLLDRGSDEKRIVDLAHAGPNAGLQLVVKRGQYTAEVSVDAICAGNELRQNLHISARPTANAIDRLMVYSTASLGDHLHWFESSTNAPIAAERLPANDPQRANLPKDGDLWLLRLPQPTSNLVEISASAIDSAPRGFCNGSGRDKHVAMDRCAGTGSGSHADDGVRSRRGSRTGSGSLPLCAQRLSRCRAHATTVDQFKLGECGRSTHDSAIGTGIVLQARRPGFASRYLRAPK